MLDKSQSEQISVSGIATGALVGALLGAIFSLALMTLRTSDSQERAAAPNFSNYLRLGVAMFMLAKQASELLARPSEKQQA